MISPLVIFLARSNADWNTTTPAVPIVIAIITFTTKTSSIIWTVYMDTSGGFRSRSRLEIAFLTFSKSVVFGLLVGTVGVVLFFVDALFLFICLRGLVRFLT